MRRPSLLRVSTSDSDKRHRDALMFVGAQDLSVLAALLLLAATGPGGLSVDAKYGKGNLIKS